MCARVYVCHLFLCAYYIVLYTLVSTLCISYKSVYQSFMIPKIFTLIQTCFLLKKHVSANGPCEKILATT